MGETAISEFFRNKWVRLFIVVDIIVVVVMIALMIRNTTKLATLTFNVVPVDAKITLNGKGNYGNGTQEVTPGNYEIQISRDGLDSKTFQVNLSNNETASITTYLTSNGNIDFYKARDQKVSFDKLAEMVASGNNTTTDNDTSAESQVALLQNLYGMMGTLPINDTHYSNTSSGRRMDWDITIRTGTDEDCETWLCIEALMLKTDDEEKIQQLLINKGFDLEAYELKYKTY